MRVIREFDLGGRKVLVRELTMGELRAWLAEQAMKASADFVDELFAEEDLRISDLPHFCDLTPDELESRAPSELRPLISAIREVNADFFPIWRRRLNEANQLIAQTALTSASPAASPDWSGSTAMPMPGVTPGRCSRPRSKSAGTHRRADCFPRSAPGDDPAQPAHQKARDEYRQGRAGEQRELVGGDELAGRVADDHDGDEGGIEFTHEGSIGHG